MNVTKRRTSIVLWVILTAVMIATRYHHFGTALNLPDASMAVFFLGGLGLRRHAAYAWFMLLAVVLDGISVGLAGVSDYCVTPAYAFLLLAYAVLWYAGRAYARHLRPSFASMAGALGAALVAASLSFVVSNGSFYWLGGRYPDPNFAQYLSRLWQWGPLFVRTTMTYVGAALVAYLLVGKWLMQHRDVEAGVRS